MSFDIRARLIAHTEPVADRDLLRAWQPGPGFLFEHRTGGVVGVDAAATITVAPGDDQVARGARLAAELLARIDGEALVVGAFPFDGRTPATLVVPRVAIRRSQTGTTRTVVGDPIPIPDEGPVGHEPTDVRTSPVPEPDAYVEAVKRARDLIASGALRKVVLARMLVAHADHSYDRRAILARLRAAEPDAYVFAAGGFLGATPELLARRTGTRIESIPLAGTATRVMDPDGAALLASAKDRSEHAIVVEAVTDALAPRCATLDVPADPSLVATARLWHLGTRIEGTLRDPATSALEVVARLHPTPAVCGTPTGAAMRAIGDLERIDRTLYAGAVGWMDARGDGEWAVALRCAEVRGRMAMLFAGAGIVEDSDPDAELAETDAKFRAMLDALGYA